MQKPSIEIRGIEKQRELSKKKIQRDNRRFSEVVSAFLVSNEGFMCTMFGLILTSILFPAFTLLVFLMSFGLYRKRMKFLSMERLPFRVPITTGIKDKGDPLPGRQAFAKAEGIFYVGQEQGTLKQLWLKAKDVLTHMLVFGTTGSGKTEFLVSLSFNAVALGSGFIYVDPKGSPKLAFQLYTMCRMLGREDDFRLMNFNMGGRAVSGRTPKRMSNTQNPFAFASADSIVQLISSLIPKTDGGNSIFSQNAQTILSGVIYALVDLRDKGFLDLSTATIGEYLVLKKADELARDSRLSIPAMEHIHSSLRTIGWIPEKSLEDQTSKSKNIMEQFSYAKAYFGSFLTSMGYTYGYIFNNNIGEIDIYDIIMQRRVLCVILPALDKSPLELENLGKIILSSVRNATAVGLGQRIQGTAEDVLHSLPTDSPIPFLVIVDEYAAIPTPGFAEVLTQGRSLGIAAVVASQDFSGVKGASEETKKAAMQIVANTKVKLVMKNEDYETFELVKNIAGRAQITKLSRLDQIEDSIMGGFKDSENLDIAEEDRINIIDLQEQTEGEFHAFFNGQVVRGNGFYADPKIERQSQLRIRQLLPVEKPSREFLFQMKEKAEAIARTMEEMILKSELLKLKEEEAHEYFDDESLEFTKKLAEGMEKHKNLSAENRTIVSFMDSINNKYTPQSLQFNKNTEEAFNENDETYVEQAAEFDSLYDLKQERKEKEEVAESYKNDDILNFLFQSITPKGEKNVDTSQE